MQNIKIKITLPEKVSETVKSEKINALYELLKPETAEKTDEKTA